MTDLPPIILGSSSKTRKKLFNTLQLDFSVISPDIDESPSPSEDAKSLSQRLALEKNIALRNKVSMPAILISCDQTMLLNEEIIGKPRNSSDAIDIITRCSGQTAYFYTSLCVYDPLKEKTYACTVTTTVLYRAYTAETAVRYIQKENTLNAAGAIHCEGLGISLLQSIQSDDPNALLGLPLIELCGILNKIGVKSP
jgi:septum formation protein